MGITLPATAELEPEMDSWFKYQTTASDAEMDIIYGALLQPIIDDIKSPYDILDATKYALFNNIDPANKRQDFEFPDRRLARPLDVKVGSLDARAKNFIK